MCLQAEVAELRSERDKQAQMFNNQQHSDKEVYKVRLAEAERKAKEADAKRSNLVFEMEKEKARW